MTTKGQPTDATLSQLAIHNWNNWQTFRKDRGTPPWIKIHRAVMTNRKWAVLSDAEKGQLVSMWIAAADNDGHLPADPVLIRKICQLDNAPDLAKFQELGLIRLTRRRSDAKVTPA
jgi:hypothetical protein